MVTYIRLLRFHRNYAVDLPDSQVQYLYRQPHAIECTMPRLSLGLLEARRLTLGNINPLPAEYCSLGESVDRIAAEDLFALVDSPSSDSSRKDGYAVISSEVEYATPENPVLLRLIGSMAAGGEQEIRVAPGTAVRILTGARIPPGADAIVSEEFAREGETGILIERSAKSMNIQRKGSDVARGDCILRKGQPISPMMSGLLAAAGYSSVPVGKNPVVGIIGTGDEIIEPGQPLSKGKLYASNIMTLSGWCARYSIRTTMAIVRDDEDALAHTIREMAGNSDALITSGGAWTGDHDIVDEVLSKLGWKKVFHRIRIGPGKATGFGLLDGKPVFILAGGPPSNLMGFLQIALPGLLALSGHRSPGLPVGSARLMAGIDGGQREWTDFYFGTLEWKEGMPDFYPMGRRNPLKSLAEATGVVSIPEGTESVPAGSIIPVQWIQ